jgi:hypothetical protein
MHLLMSAIEDGTVAGPGLSVFETIVTFVLIPLTMFFVIAGLSWVGSRPRTEKKKSEITSIQ